MNNIQFKKDYSVLIPTVYPSQQLTGKPKAPAGAGQPKVPFSRMLQDSIRETSTGITFSKHAVQRVDDRKIEVSPQLMQRMASAVDKAQSKGVTEALILSGSTAFIVNVPNRTVVTTMDGSEMKESVFTNIDGAVIL